MFSGHRLVLLGDGRRDPYHVGTVDGEAGEGGDQSAASPGRVATAVVIEAVLDRAAVGDEDERSILTV